MSVDVESSRNEENTVQDEQLGTEGKARTMSQFRERVKTNTPDHHNSECASNENNIDRKENFKKATEMKQRTLFNTKASTAIPKDVKACSLSLGGKNTQIGEDEFQKERAIVTVFQFKEGTNTKTTDHYTTVPVQNTERKENFKISTKKKKRRPFCKSRQCSSMTEKPQEVKACSVSLVENNAQIEKDQCQEERAKETVSQFKEGTNTKTTEHNTAVLVQNIERKENSKIYTEMKRGPFSKSQLSSSMTAEAATAISETFKAFSVSLVENNTQIGEDKFQEERAKEKVSQVKEGAYTNTTDHNTAMLVQNIQNMDRKENSKISTEMKRRPISQSQQCSSMTGILLIFCYYIRYS
ncbi:unnamed protein product [Mytilus edulis]|uniref:Uncharacterized protein n=1 Tax=Mytilus edulis TaxID=6550 RepID=A0A8S3R8U0_MYTED|nr:unnamed protein product [Mytilus edulis]